MSSSNGAGRRRPSRLRQYWRRSLPFRRITAISVFALATLLVYVGSHIPRAVSLPVDDLNAKSTARLGEERIILRKPEIAPGDLALSYVGSKNEVADIWLDNATLDDQSQHLLFQGSAPATPGRISYTTGGGPSPSKPEDTCHTVIEIRRATGSAPIDTLKLYQTDEMAGAQRFRQVVLDAGASQMEIEVHTDPPSEGLADVAGCHKLLTVGNNTPIDLPPIPVRMLAHSGKIDLHFNPANPAVTIFTGPDQTFEAVSLGDNMLRAVGLQVVSERHPAALRLDVRPSPSDSGITFSRLKLGSDMLKLDIGRDTEKAVAYANGSSLYNYDLIDVIQKNPILSFAFASVLVPALWNWIRKNCFPTMSDS
jgi:hypothetical protein